MTSSGKSHSTTDSPKNKSYQKNYQKAKEDKENMSLIINNQVQQISQQRFVLKKKQVQSVGPSNGNTNKSAILEVKKIPLKLISSNKRQGSALANVNKSTFIPNS